MATGDTSDVLSRLKSALPTRWFGDVAPIRDALLTGLATAHSFIYSLYAYAKLQTRIKTASDGWLDLIAADFFGAALTRSANQTDASLLGRILINLFRERGTRNAIVKVLTDLTGRAPLVFEPQRPADTGAYGGAVQVSQPGFTTLIDSTGVLRYVPPNTPRYQNNALLIEAAATNFALYSSQFDNSFWGKVGLISVSPDSSAAPDGTNTADTVTDSDTVNPCLLQGNCAAQAIGTVMTASVFMKQGTATQSTFNAYDQGNAENNLIINWSGGVPTLSSFAGPSGATYAIQSVGNGWYRLSVTWTVLFNALCPLRIWPCNRNTASQTGSIVVWGAQMEPSPAPTSYIPSNPGGTAVTRAADTLVSAGITNVRCGYNVAGGYGSLMLPYQAFVQAYRPLTSGIPNVAGWGIPTGAYSTPSQADYAALSSVQGSVQDADIYAAVDGVRPAGVTLWTRISS